MKKILWMSHLLPYPPKGGVLQRSYNLIREASKSFEVTLLAFNQGNLCASEKELCEGVEHLSQFCRVVDVTKISSEQSLSARIILLIKGLMPNSTYTVSWLQSNEYARKISIELAREHYDLIHVDTISLVPYILNYRHARKILNHHNIESLMMLRRSENEKHILKKMYFYQEAIKLRKYEESVCNKFDLNVTCSRLDVDRLKTICPGIECIDVPNGVDLSYFLPKIVPQVDKSLIFAGGLSWYPNLDAMTFFLKDVWPKLVVEIPDVSMTVIGRSPPNWMLEMQSQYKNLEVTGFVDDVRPYFDKASVYVCPIRDGGGTKLKVLDALAMGKPLIANPIACEGIDVEEGKDVYFATTADDYIRMIKKVFADKEGRNSLGLNGRKLIEEKYNFVAIGKKLNSHYLELIN